MATYSISNAFKRSTTRSDPHSARGFSIFCAFAMKEFPFYAYNRILRVENISNPRRAARAKTPTEDRECKIENRDSLSSIFNPQGFLGWLAFYREPTRPSGSASLAAPPVEQQSNRTSASRLENPPVSLGAFRGARPMDRWRYRQSYTRQRGIPSYRVVDPRLCKAAALLCDSVR